MGHNPWLHFDVDEHPFATYFDVHQGYRVLTHSHIPLRFERKFLPCQTSARHQLPDPKFTSCSPKLSRP